MTYSYYSIHLDSNFNVIFFYVEKLKVVKAHVLPVAKCVADAVGYRLDYSQFKKV